MFMCLYMCMCIYMQLLLKIRRRYPIPTGLELGAENCGCRELNTSLLKDQKLGHISGPIIAFFCIRILDAH